MHAGESAGDSVMLPGGQGPVVAKRCPECGVDLKVGVKYCDFCGNTVAAAAPPPVDDPQRGTTGGVLKGLVVGLLAIGVLAYVGINRREHESPPPAPSSGLDAKHQAAATCEAAIRQRAPAPFRVIAFRSTLVAEDGGGHAVSGSVELQSTAGEVQLKRYFCRVRPDAKAGLVLDEGKIY